jgi:uncharacterized beta-barrel protein YwiB (DUF1934 family)
MKQVLVTVIGIQQDMAGEQQRLELITLGRYYERNGVRYITYAESQISGLEGTTTVLKVYPDYIVLLRMGKIEQKQEFRLQRKTYSKYVTAFGRMELGVFTNILEIGPWVAGASTPIMIHYDLEIDGQRQSTNILSVVIQEEHKDEH